MKTIKLAALLVLFLALLALGQGVSARPYNDCLEVGSVPTDLAVRRFVSQPTNTGTAACLRLMASVLQAGPVCVIEHLWYGVGSAGEAVMKLAYWPVCEPGQAPDSPATEPALDSPAAPSLVPIEPNVRYFACLYTSLWPCLDAAANYLDEWDRRICAIEHIWVQPDSFDGNLAVVKLAFWPCPPPG